MIPGHRSQHHPVRHSDRYVAQKARAQQAEQSPLLEPNGSLQLRRCQRRPQPLHLRHAQVLSLPPRRGLISPRPCRFDSALCVHKDHVSAVLDVDFAPTVKKLPSCLSSSHEQQGREFVSGSYDRTVRIFKYNSGRSREVRSSPPPHRSPSFVPFPASHLPLPPSPFLLIPLSS
eukprot:766679-Hanusia_phi.AAC.2